MSSAKLIDPNDLITPREAARILQVVPRTIGNYRDSGLVDFVQINARRFLYSKTSLLKMMTARKKSATDPLQLSFF
jgi:predicted site-specific integrase-resolvase